MRKADKRIAAVWHVIVVMHRLKIDLPNIFSHWKSHQNHLVLVIPIWHCLSLGNRGNSVNFIPG